MDRVHRSAVEWILLAVVAAVVPVAWAVTVWLVSAAAADNVEIAFGLGISEQAADWLALVPTTVLTGVVVALAARPRHRWIAIPASVSTTLAALVLGAYQIASIGRA